MTSRCTLLITCTLQSKLIKIIYKLTAVEQIKNTSTKQTTNLDTYWLKEMYEHMNLVEHFQWSYIFILFYPFSPFFDRYISFLFLNMTKFDLKIKPLLHEMQGWTPIDDTCIKRRCKLIFIHVGRQSE